MSIFGETSINENFITESQNILNDDGGLTHLLTDSEPHSNGHDSFNSEKSNVSYGLQSPTQTNIPLSQQCQAIYDKIRNNPKEVFVTDLIENTKGNVQLLDKMRTELFDEAKRHPDFPEGVLAKRKKNRRHEKLATDCYHIHMYLNGVHSDEIQAVLSGGGRYVPLSATPLENKSNEIRPDLIANVASLNASVSALGDFTEKIYQRITVGINHCVDLIKSKDKWVEQIEEVVNYLNKTADELGTKVVELGTKVVKQDKIMISLESEITGLRSELKSSETKYESALAEIVKLTVALRDQKELFDSVSHEDVCEKDRIKGDIKVIRRSVRGLQEEVNLCSQSVNSCSTSITYLRNQTAEINSMLSNDVPQERYADVVSRPKYTKAEQIHNACPPVPISGPNHKPYWFHDVESADFSEHESSDDNMSLKKVIQPPQYKSPEVHSHHRQVQHQPVIPIRRRVQPEGHQTRDSPGAPIQVVTKSRIFYSRASCKLFVGNISAQIHIDQVKRFLQNKNIQCTNIKMLPSKVEGKIGAQIIIRECDVKRILSSSFWPKDVYARRWYD
jgi:hypothetical protein